MRADACGLVTVSSETGVALLWLFSARAGWTAIVVSGDVVIARDVSGLLAADERVIA